MEELYLKSFNPSSLSQELNKSLGLLPDPADLLTLLASTEVTGRKKFTLMGTERGDRSIVASGAVN